MYHKGRTSNRRVINEANAEIKEHGIDLCFKLSNDAGRGNLYMIEVKGNLKSDGLAMKSNFLTNFRSAISEIVLRIKVDSTRNSYIYGIAIPDSEFSRCKHLIENNWALKHLKIRIYGAYRLDKNTFDANEYTPKDIYR